MDENSQRPKSRDGVLSSLNVTIEALNLAKEISGITPAKAAFGSVSVLLTMIRVLSSYFATTSFGLTRTQDSMGNELDYVELGLSCADICRALERGMSGKKLGDLSQSVCDAINQLTTSVEPVTRSLDGSLKIPLITGLLPRYKGRSSSRVDGTQRLDFFTRATIRKCSPVGS